LVQTKVKTKKTKLRCCASSYSPFWWYPTPLSFELKKQNRFVLEKVCDQLHFD
jgi:hypothetical protein